MNDNLIEDKYIIGINFSREQLVNGDYDKCTFENCIFTKTDLSEMVFSDCIFTNCDISLVKVNNTAYREVKFKNCKLLGIHFEDCNQFGFSVAYDNCLINLASFYKMNLRSSFFRNCSLVEADFTESDMTALNLENCNLSGAIFDHTNLEKTDFRTSINYSIDPDKNKIKKAKFSITGIIGLLDKYDIEIG